MAIKKSTPAAPKVPKTTPVVVQTSDRFIFFGYVPEGTNLDVRSLRLEQARNCIRYYNTKGHTGLASHGPNKECRISRPVVSITVQNILNVTEATPEAAAEWEKGYWS